MKNLIRRDFTQIPNELIGDSTIDKSARFLFCYLCSKPDDWEFYNAELCRGLGCSEDTLRKYMNQLMEKGWITKQQKQAESGVWGSNDITLHPYPNFSDTVLLPSRKKTDTEKNRIGKTTEHNNTDLITNTDLKTNNETLLFSEEEVVPLHIDVIKYLNSKIGGSGFRLVNSNYPEIIARAKDGYKLEDFKKVIDSKCLQWLNDPKNKMYLRPSTLFQSKKFSGYLMVADSVIKTHVESVDTGKDNFVKNMQNEAQWKKNS